MSVKITRVRIVFDIQFPISGIFSILGGI